MFRDRIPHARTTRAPFARDERGAILVLWALFLAVAFGFLALAFDLGRIATTQTQLQSFADQVALAAAGELDGRDTSITRATAAALGAAGGNGLIAGQQTFAIESQTLGASDVTLTFYSSLPNDETEDPAAFATTNPGLARFVRAQVSQKTVLTPFAHVNAVLTGSSQLSAGVSATATAGFTSFACEITPLFFCVPDNTWRADANIGDQIQLRAGGQGAAWGPGNFGFLEPNVPLPQSSPCFGLNGAPLYECLVGAVRPVPTCVEVRPGLTTEPGQRVGLAEAFNTRFDIYQGNMNNPRYKGNKDYAPAPNTIQGTKPRGGGLCRGNNTDVSAAMPLPRDTCITGGTCGRFGDGTWNRTAYFTKNHPGGRPPALNGIANPTRYQTYLAEIDKAKTNTPAVPLPGFDETGAPQCYTGGAPSTPDRRVVIAAAVDCTANDIRGSSSGIIPVEFVKLFMTEPVQSASSNLDIMVEVIGSAGGTGKGIVEAFYQDFVQLYR